MYPDPSLASIDEVFCFFLPFALGSELDWAEGDDGSFVWCHTGTRNGIIPVCSTGRVQFGKVETGSGDIPEAASCCGHAKKGGSGPLRHR